MKNYPLCKKCHKPLKRYDATYHRKCYLKVHPQKGINNNAYDPKVCKPFAQIDKKTGKILTVWKSLGDISRCLGVKPWRVQRVLHGKAKSFRKCFLKYL